MLVAFICADFYSLKPASKPFISGDIDDFAFGNFSYRGPLAVSVQHQRAKLPQVSHFLCQNKIIINNKLS